MQTKQETAAEWLRKFITEINTQDNRSTACPYFFTLCCPKKEVGVADDCSDGFDWYDPDNSEEVTNVKERLWQLWGDKKALENHIFGASLRSKDDIGDTLLEVLATAQGWYKVNYRMTTEYKGFFFTEAACKTHLEGNKHHYPEGTSIYLDHAFRHPELLLLLQNIGKVVGVEYLKY